MIEDADRKFLWALSYRLTGSAADAEDVVQEAYARALEGDIAVRGAPRPWLTRVATRLSIDRLRERRARASPGVWLPGLVLTPEDEPDLPATDALYDLRESASLAFLVALEVLTPDQRAVTVLRDVFELSATEVGELLELSPANVRQLHVRARAALASHDQERSPINAATRLRSREVLDAFLAAVVDNDPAAAARVLRQDVRAVTDGGGRYHAVGVPVVGANRVFRLFRGLAEKRPPVDMVFRVCNGLWVVDARFDTTTPRFAPRTVMGLVPGREGLASLVFTQAAPERLPAP